MKGIFIFERENHTPVVVTEDTMLTVFRLASYESDESEKEKVKTFLVDPGTELKVNGSGQVETVIGKEIKTMSLSEFRDGLKKYIQSEERLGPKERNKLFNSFFQTPTVLLYKLQNVVIEKAFHKEIIELMNSAESKELIRVGIVTGSDWWIEQNGRIVTSKNSATTYVSIADYDELVNWCKEAETFVLKKVNEDCTLTAM